MRTVKCAFFKYLVRRIPCIWLNLPYSHSCNELKLNKMAIISGELFQSAHSNFDWFGIKIPVLSGK